MIIALAAPPTTRRPDPTAPLVVTDRFRPPVCRLYTDPSGPGGVILKYSHAKPQLWRRVFMPDERINGKSVTLVKAKPFRK